MENKFKILKKCALIKHNNLALYVKQYSHYITNKSLLYCMNIFQKTISYFGKKSFLNVCLYLARLNIKARKTYNHKLSHELFAG